MLISLPNAPSEGDLHNILHPLLTGHSLKSQVLADTLGYTDSAPIVVPYGDIAGAHTFSRTHGIRGQDDDFWQGKK